MKDENLPDLTSATTQLAEMRSAINAGDYSALQGMLLHHSIVLHNLGMEFLDQSLKYPGLREKSAFLDIGLRALSQSQKAMGAVKMLKR